MFSGQTGDEGWFAFQAIQSSWQDAGPSSRGSINFLEPGPGLGQADSNGDREYLLDKVENLVPLRATALAMLKGETVLAVVYDDDIDMNYSPMEANLKGANLGLIAFDIVEVTPRTGASDSSLPVVRIRIRDLNDVGLLPLMIFSNPPIPDSSSEPVDVEPANNLPPIDLSPAM